MCEACYMAVNGLYGCQLCAFQVKACLQLLLNKQMQYACTC
jgi:hypothetical protein